MEFIATVWNNENEPVGSLPSKVSGRDITYVAEAIDGSFDFLNRRGAHAGTPIEYPVHSGKADARFLGNVAGSRSQLLLLRKSQCRVLHWPKRTVDSRCQSRYYISVI